MKESSELTGDWTQKVEHCPEIFHIRETRNYSISLESFDAPLPYSRSHSQLKPHSLLPFSFSLSLSFSSTPIFFLFNLSKNLFSINRHFLSCASSLFIFPSPTIAHPSHRANAIISASRNFSLSFIKRWTEKWGQNILFLGHHCCGIIPSFLKWNFQENFVAKLCQVFFSP